MNEENVAESFHDLWADIVCPGGVWDHDQVMRELHDYAQMLNEVPKVYDHVTGGRVSKPNTMASAVIGEADDRRDEEFRERLRDDALILDTIDGINIAMRHAHSRNCPDCPLILGDLLKRWEEVGA